MGFLDRDVSGKGNSGSVCGCCCWRQLVVASPTEGRTVRPCSALDGWLLKKKRLVSIDGFDGFFPVKRVSDEHEQGAFLSFSLEKFVINIFVWFPMQMKEGGGDNRSTFARLMMGLMSRLWQAQQDILFGKTTSSNKASNDGKAYDKGHGRARPRNGRCRRCADGESGPLLCAPNHIFFFLGTNNVYIHDARLLLVGQRRRHRRNWTHGAC